ncbi:hypothetical protein [Algoriphagus sp. AGSA1]
MNFPRQKICRDIVTKTIEQTSRQDCLT